MAFFLSLSIFWLSLAAAFAIWIIRRAMGLVSQREELMLKTRVEIAKHTHFAPVPQSINITYSPHTRHTNTIDHPGSLQAPAGEIQQATSLPPTFSDVVENVKNGQFVMGLKPDGTPILGDWHKMYSAGIGGLQGTGKSWTAAFILCQSRILGAEIWCIDPHAHSQDSLYNRVKPILTRPVAVIVEEIEMMAAQLNQEITDRVNTGKETPQIVLVIDEWSYLVYTQGATELHKLLSRIATAGRKHGVFAMIIAHKWTVKEMGGNSRSLLSAFYLHRMRKDEARVMTNLTELPGDLLQLGDGEAYLLDHSGVLQRVSIPRMTNQDVIDVGEKMTTRNDCSLVEPKVKTVTAREQKVVELLKEGKSMSTIVKEVWGVSGGEAYKEASKELRIILLDLIHQ
jgi:hypothetical protein